MYGSESNYLILLLSKTAKKPAENLPKPAYAPAEHQNISENAVIPYNRIPDWNK